ncbi:AAA family ATPase [Primorskyibacter aestuariivivens]|uniref:AAA family ATPase n=1 Tax=Primorskyibacter aestuariivivens TaxID=1888912 RepID=UPI0023001A14|nr:AAA family ATPase [Primorskyibacter aestuariivivens]MDA7429790.1 AAA family ATPase [Primorskyibacter aestuariivivens]
MRFLNRAKMRPPSLLSSVRAEAARAELEAFIARSSEKGATRRVPSHAWLTDAPEARAHMHAQFGGTCAYCETPTTYLGDKRQAQGLIGHHRPEGLAEDDKGETDFLAYSWLIYDWDNLLWICTDCARRKDNRFFIENTRGTPFMSISELRASEAELMLDPSFHDPAEHLAFQMDGSVTWKTAPGDATVFVLELNRPELVAARAKALRAVLRAMRENPLNVEAHLTGAGSDDSRYVLRAVVPDDKDSNLKSLAPDKSSSRNPSWPQYRHAGASTMALLGFARMRGMAVRDALELRDLILDLAPDSRDGFLEDALDTTTRAITDAEDKQKAETERSARHFEVELSPPPAAPRKKTPNRIPDIHRLSTARTPVTRVEISNFKALRDISFDLPETVPSTSGTESGQSPCMILLGENATGKSSVLEAMALAIAGANEAKALDGLLKDEALAPRDLIHRPDPSKWDQPAPGMAVRLTFRDHSAPIGLDARPGDTRFRGHDSCAKVVLGYGPRRYFTNRRTTRFRAPAHRIRSLFDPMDMIANPIHWLSGLEGKAFFAAARVLRVILMLDNEDDFERDDDPKTPGAIFVRQNGQRTALKDLSVGYKSVIAMACDIIRELSYHFDNIEKAHAIVFVDEIETHLHPRWKMRIMQLLREAFPNVQFIVTTHDPLCLRGMHDGEVFVLQRAGPDAQVEKVPDLPSIRGMRADQILTSEFFGLGSTDPDTDIRLELYNALASRVENLSPEEEAKLRELRDWLGDNMVIGSTLAEQAYAKALKREAAREVTPTKAPSPRRQDVEQAFSAFLSKDFDA